MNFIDFEGDKGPKQHAGARRVAVLSAGFSSRKTRGFIVRIKVLPPIKHRVLSYSGGFFYYRWRGPLPTINKTQVLLAMKVVWNCFLSYKCSSNWAALMLSDATFSVDT